jgi:hypothetical protein
MSNLLACPDPRQLERLANGELPDDEAEALSSHVLACSPCADRLNAACANDQLAADLRSGVNRSLVETATAEAIVEQLVRMPPETSLTACSTMGLGARDAGSMPAKMGRYLITSVVGAGGMGVVFRAHDPQLQRDVAIKMPSFHGSAEACAAARQRFLREARAAAAVRHPNVCPIHDVGEEGGRPYVVMAFIEGETLGQQMRRRQRFDNPAEAVALIAQVADALTAVHALNIVHRDLKPGNILLDRAGVPFLTDFGLARADDSEQLTSADELVGTPAFMSPEQAAPDFGPVGPWSDQYSLAVVLYQMLTGRLPFEGSSRALIFQIGTRAAPPPSQHRPDLDPALERVLMKAMSRPASARFGSVSEFASALRAAAGTSGRAETEPRLSAPPAKRRGLQVVCAVALLALAGLGGLAYQLYFRTADGLVQIEINDPDIQVVFDQKDFVFKGVGEMQDLRVRAGVHGLHVKRGSLEFDTDKPVVIKNGETVTLKITWLKDGKVQVLQGDEVIGEALTKSTPADAVAKLPAGSPIAAAYRALPSPAKLLGQSLTGVDGGYDGARYMRFQQGEIIQPPGVQTAFAIHGPMYNAYQALPKVGPLLGQPTSAIEPRSGGGLGMRFQRGQFFLPPKSQVAFVIYGPVDVAYRALSDPDGTLGQPKSGIQTGSVGAVYVQFERGEIILPPDSDKAYVLAGELYKAYKGISRYPFSTVGHPVSDEYAFEGGRRIDFQKGYITWTEKDGGKVHAK